MKRGREERGQGKSIEGGRDGKGKGREEKEMERENGSGEREGEKGN